MHFLICLLLLLAHYNAIVGSKTGSFHYDNKLEKNPFVTKKKLLNIFYDKWNEKHVILFKKLTNMFQVPFTITLQDIDHLLISRKDLKSNDISLDSMVYDHGSEWRVIKRVIKKDTGEYWSSSRKHSNMTLGAAKHAFTKGYTIVINNAQLKSVPLYCAVKDLENILGVTVTANIYLTPPQQQGFEIHMDYMDVLVVQIFGQKGWKISSNGPHIPYPRGDMLFKPNVSVNIPYDEEYSLSRVILSPGNALYIPRGTFHEASTKWVTESGSNTLWLENNRIVNPDTVMMTGPDREERSRTSMKSDVLLTSAALTSLDSLHVTFGIEVANDFTVEMFIHNTIINHIREMEAMGVDVKVEKGSSTTQNTAQDRRYHTELLTVPYLPYLSEGAKYAMWHLIVSEIATGRSTGQKMNNEESSQVHSMRRSLHCRGNDALNHRLVKESLMYIKHQMNTSQGLDCEVDNNKNVNHLVVNDDFLSNILWKGYKMQLYNIRVFIIEKLDLNIGNVTQDVAMDISGDKARVNVEVEKSINAINFMDPHLDMGEVHTSTPHQYHIVAEHSFLQDSQAADGVEIPNYLKNRFLSKASNASTSSSSLSLFLPVDAGCDMNDQDGCDISKSSLKLARLVSYVQSNSMQTSFTSGSSSVSGFDSENGEVDGSGLNELLMRSLKCVGSTNDNMHAKGSVSDVVEGLSKLLSILELNESTCHPNRVLNEEVKPSGVDLLHSYLTHLNDVLIEKQYTRFQQMKEWTQYSGEISDMRC